MRPSLSVAMPVYNEAAVIERVIDDVERELRPRFANLEVVVVDDCSQDSTGSILEALRARRPGLRVLTNATNLGHGPTVRRAVDATTGDWIFQVDSDRQFDVTDFWKLWAARDKADLVLGYRAVRRDALHRRLLTRLVRYAVSLLLARPVRDPNIPFRLYRRRLWADVRPWIPEAALAPSIMTAMSAVARGWRTAEVPVRHLPREHGPSTLRAWRLFKFSARGLGEIVRLRLRLLGKPRRAEDALLVDLPAGTSPAGRS